MTENLTFFDIAAGLIPVLLLGGAVAEHLRSAAPADTRAIPTTSGRLVTVLLAVVFGLFAVFAEVLAIDAALTDDYSTVTAWVVASAVTLGTWGLAGAVVWPWVEVLVRPRVPAGEVPPRSFRWARRFLIVGLLFTVVMSGVLLRQAIQVEATKPQAAAYRQAILQDIDAEEELLDAQVVAGRMPERLAKRLRLNLARHRADLTQQLIEERRENAADAFD